ncbi:uncharacterized protein LOC114244201 [Bombyx mandarina]|uniref:Uncharacterized protein LOC114244201 n=1 Tax=Bombyx mandarina TaxID=7092 RepID=A0A6J2JU63_BOMMA|nr:uncharacterized protein LOC114244201 [Bombyx mandarina]
MSKVKKYVPSTPEFEKTIGRYKEFVTNLDDPDSEPIRVFDPLSQSMLEELALIRDVSKYLQKKKIEDVNKAAQAAQLEAEGAKKNEEEAVEPPEKNEDKKDE